MALNNYFLAFVFIFLTAATLHSEEDSFSYHLSGSLDELDSKITEAFNANPKQTKQVYLYALEMIQLGRDRHSLTGDKWIRKAKKLITLACFNETQNYLNDKNARQAFIWCERGISYGATEGVISDYNVGKFYTGLTEFKTILDAELKASGESISQAQLIHEINNTGKVEREIADSGRKTIKTNVAADDNFIKLAKGPLQDMYGNIIVNVNISGKGEFQIQYFQGKGWGCVMFGKMPERFYLSWYECAKSL